MAYAKQTWLNGVAGATPISAARLSYMEAGIETANSGFANPKAFGAIGDGSSHPLSTLYASIPLASLAYPTLTLARTDVATVSNGSATILDASILSTDVGRSITGTNIPTGSRVGNVVAGVSFINTVDGFAAPATGPGTSITLTGLALTDEIDWAAHQAAIDTGLPVTVPAGTYVINRQLRHVTGGGNLPGLELLGLGPFRTKYDNRVSYGSLFYLDGAGTLGAYAYGTHVGNFSVSTTTNPTLSVFMTMRGQWSPVVNQTYVDGLSADGIRFIQYDSDLDATSFPILTQVSIIRCAGIGINCPDPLTHLSSNGGGYIQNCFIVQNALGGINLLGLDWTIEGGQIAYNGGAGARIKYVSGNVTTAKTVFRNMEFDSNQNISIAIDSALNVHIADVKFIVGTPVSGVGPGGASPGWAAGAQPTSVIRVGKVGVPTAAQSVVIDRPLVRPDNGATPLCVEIMANATNTIVNDLFIMNGLAAQVTKYSDGGVNTIIRDNSKNLIPETKTVAVTVSASGTTYTPRILATGQGDVNPGGDLHRITITAAGTLTIGSPVIPGNASFPADGLTIAFEISNASGGVVTITFDSNFRMAGYVDPANGFGKSARFMFNATTNRWRLLGAWSPDIPN